MQGLRYCCIYFENLRWIWKRLITAPEFTEWEWSVAERRIFRCGAATSGDRLRARFSPFAICNRGNLSGIDRGYADPVIVHEYVPENDALHLTLRQFVADFSFFKVAKSFPFSHCQSNLRYRWGSEQVLHPGAQSWMPRRLLTSPVAVKDRSADLFPVLQSKLRCGSDAALLLHIAVHCCGGYDFAGFRWRFEKYTKNKRWVL